LSNERHGEDGEDHSKIANRERTTAQTNVTRHASVYESNVISRRRILLLQRRLLRF
jgi:hypothetical protein